MTQFVDRDSTDGFRGIAEVAVPGPDRANPETFALLTSALVREMPASGERQRSIVVAGDTRPSTEALVEGVVAGARRENAHVHYMGVAPTPAAQWAAKRTHASGTVVVTASHNPAEYNGWKGMPGYRKPLPSEVERIHGTYFRDVVHGVHIPVSASAPTVRRDLLDQYQQAVIRDIRANFEDILPLDGKVVVYDGANGAAKEVMPQVFESLGATVIRYACGDGVINEGCGAADLDGLHNFLAQNPTINSDNLLGAFANDGDGDRMMGVALRPDGSTATIDGNHMMHALAQGEPGIVGTLYTNYGLVSRLRDEGIGFAECPNGDSYVTQKLVNMQRQGLPWRRGGEFTGHLIDTDWLPSGDGVRMAAWYASYLVSRGMTMADAHDALPLWATHQIKVPHQLSRDGLRAVMNHPDLCGTLDVASDAMGDQGRHIVRPSGTEPIIRVYVEAAQPEVATEMSATIAHRVMSLVGK